MPRISSTIKAKTVDLMVPAHAEIVLEGYVVPGEEKPEGPFGDHTGYYSMTDLDQVMFLPRSSIRMNLLLTQVSRILEQVLG